MPQEFDELKFEIDHIIAEQHKGKTALSNLCLSCFTCNRAKGPNLSGRDEFTWRTVLLFNPRRHKWQRHFEWDGPILVGRTSVGRATIDVLKINAEHRVELRQELIDEDRFPRKLL
jgi:hypothetical protein